MIATAAAASAATIKKVENVVTSLYNIAGHMVSKFTIWICLLSTFIVGDSYKNTQINVNER